MTDYPRAVVVPIRPTTAACPNWCVLDHHAPQNRGSDVHLSGTVTPIPEMDLFLSKVGDGDPMVMISTGHGNVAEVPPADLFECAIAMTRVALEGCSEDLR